jgi:membrane-bound lytic murein transglycosylase A
MFKINRSVPSLAILLLLAACRTQLIEPTPPVVVPVSPVTTLPPVEAKTASFKSLNFDAIPGWAQDNLTEAWPAFKASCTALINKPDWHEPCTIAQNVDGKNNDAVRQFFEAFFSPFLVINPDGTDTGLITGYYEPLLHGARQRGGVFQTPLYQAPPDLLTIDMTSVYPELKGMRLRGHVVGNKVLPYPSRAELLQTGALAGSEICWVDDSVDAFFLQVQGSGRVLLTDSKETIRLAYADQNGQPYKSIGRYLVDQGELKLEQASAQGIKNWIATHPARENEVLNANPSYVFFKEERLLDPNQGPNGALGVALTEKRSIAIDAKYLPLGAPIFINTTQPNSDLPVKRLMMAQDTGGAIRGAVRADFFWGFGQEAGEMAGRMKQRGMLWVLWPKLAAAPPGVVAN